MRHAFKCKSLDSEIIVVTTLLDAETATKEDLARLLSKSVELAVQNAGLACNLVRTVMAQAATHSKAAFWLHDGLY